MFRNCNLNYISCIYNVKEHPELENLVKPTGSRLVLCARERPSSVDTIIKFSPT